MGCFCCPPNVVRTIARSSEYAYAISDRGVYVVLYGSNRLDATLAGGQHIRLVQQTDYPWDGKIRFTIDCRGEFSLMLRIPEWARNAAISINEKAHDSAVGPGFQEIRRNWSQGDVVELTLPMPVRLIEANPYVEEARNHVAVMRGPIVYCLETVDLPKGVRIMDVLLRRDAGFTARKISDLLDGLVVIEELGGPRTS